VEQLVDDEWIAVAVLSGLVRLAQHARDLTAASGNGVVRATLLPATTAYSLEIGHRRFHGIPESRSEVAIGQHHVSAEAVAPLDSMASAGPELIQRSSMKSGRPSGSPRWANLAATVLSAAAIGIGASKLLPGLSGTRSM
jgi:hypothetical protein